jgi:hypothetical protein
MSAPVQLPPRICFRRFELDFRSGEFHKNGQKVALPPKAFEVLKALVERLGEVITAGGAPFRPECRLSTPWVPGDVPSHC